VSDLIHDSFVGPHAPDQMDQLVIIADQSRSGVTGNRCQHDGHVAQ
jgi:hypothetical protein